MERLRDSQRQHLKKPEVVRKWWYVPKALDLVREALEGAEERKLLVVGCGTGEDAFLYADYLECTAVGLDLNEKAIETAIKIAEGGTPQELRAQEPEFLVGDITEEGIVERLLGEFKVGPFDAAAFIGVIGSLVTEKEVWQALKNTSGLLKPQGKIVISDFSWWRPKMGESWWEKRYHRDEEALKIYGVKGEVFGTIVVAPRGVYRGEGLLSLRAEEVARALHEGDYERLVRHWRIGKIEEILGKTDFEVLKMERVLGRWDILDHLKETVEEKDLLLNYRILAKKTLAKSKKAMGLV